MAFSMAFRTPTPLNSIDRQCGHFVENILIPIWPASILLRTAPGRPRILDNRPARRLSLVSGSLFSSGALIRASPHKLLAKDYCASLLDDVTAFQQSPTH